MASRIVLNLRSRRRESDERARLTGTTSGEDHSEFSFASRLRAARRPTVRNNSLNIHRNLGETGEYIALQNLMNLSSYTTWNDAENLASLRRGNVENAGRIPTNRFAAQNLQSRGVRPFVDMDVDTNVEVLVDVDAQAETTQPKRGHTSVFDIPCL
ncbi:hypothetical protein FRB96_008222 [Tulasnella sp. 330]|nr:hypothetical protein FRB96_008222 [Tulasnella sp. 330]KAG8880790.1 hypothetical protein FRB97_000455 [Tulasnella sp. 331]KAG8885318.1 hypothetical protein FRB98_001857 [Tulasnella sp. 332]